MNLLIIHEVHYASKIVYEFQIVPETLASQGHDVTVIDYDEQWASRKGILGTLKLDAVSRIGGPKVKVNTPGMIRLPGLSRLTYWIAAGLEIRRQLRRYRFDGIILYGMPTVGIQTWALAKWFKVPVLYRCIDATSELASKHVGLRWLTERIERFLYPKLAVSCTTPELAKYAEARGAKNPTVQPSGVDFETFKPKAPTVEIAEDPVAELAALPYSQRHRVGEVLDRIDQQFKARFEKYLDTKTILFMGTLYDFSGLDILIMQLTWLRVKHPTAKLVIVGDGEGKPRLKELARMFDVESMVVFKNRMAYADLPDLIRSADICINLFRENAISQPILPTKLFQYLACGKPVVMTRLAGTLPFLKGEEDGVVYCNVDGAAEAISALLSNPERLKQLGENAAKLSRDYDWRVIANRYVEQLCSLKQSS